MKWKDLPVRYKAAEIGFWAGAGFGLIAHGLKLLPNSDEGFALYACFTGAISGYTLGTMADVCLYFREDLKENRVKEGKLASNVQAFSGEKLDSV